MPLGRDQLSISVDPEALVHFLSDTGHAGGTIGRPSGKALAACPTPRPSKEFTMKRTSRPFRWFTTLFSAEPSVQFLTAAGSPAPYGQAGELQALPWEGLQLHATASTR
jgi:hypothetical protein